MPIKWLYGQPYTLETAFWNCTDAARFSFLFSVCARGWQISQGAEIAERLGQGDGGKFCCKTTR